MSKVLPLFIGIIQRTASFSDKGGSTKVWMEVRKIALNGEDPKDAREVENNFMICFRLEGERALEEAGAKLTADWAASGWLKGGEDIAFKKGRTAMIQGCGPARWDGKTLYNGQELRRMFTVIPESLSADPAVDVEFMALKVRDGVNVVKAAVVA